MKKQLLAALIGLSFAATTQAATPSVEEMWEIIQKQQKQISALKNQLNTNDSRLTETEIIAEATISAVEKIALEPVSVSKTHIGGYGELHYNNLEKDNGSGDKNEVDFHRFVLFTSHQFSDSIRFFSELEVEHSIAGDGQVGEVELEQAYIEWDLANNKTAKAGLFLMPVGILNETHEPDTFYGTERNAVEKNIIPATWWEAGATLNGELSPGLSYDVAAHSGLFLDDGEYKPRDGRQKVGKAKADDMAFTGRLKYTAIPGLELAASLQMQTDMHQGEGDKIAGTLFETHLAWQKDDFQLRALYAAWDFDDAINSIKAGADEQTGFYIEPSYKITEKMGVFARYSEYDNTAGSAADSAVEQMDIGMNYWLHPNVVFKIDYQNQDNSAGTGSDGINLGVGFSY
jgi:hypothetical protein